MKHLLELIIPIASSSLELVGVVIIILGAIEAIYNLIKNKFNTDNIDVKLKLAKALSLSLEFKLASEILKTVLIHTLDELLILSAVVVLRVIMTLVIHWEIQNAKEKIYSK